MVLAAIGAGEAPDLLITDVGLPAMRVLFITGYAGPAARAHFTGIGMDMIGKPFALDAFVAKVTDMLAK